MSQEIYVKEIPKDCWDCPCQDNENGRCKILNRYVDYIPKDCPLKSLHEYKKELVAKVLDKIKMLAKDNFDFDMCNECGEFVHNDNVLTESDFNKVLNQIQKEFENV